jgi:hypothetical protein
MSNTKRITDLTDYKSVLPYANEMFGVYQPMIGWRSKRMVQRHNFGLVDNQRSLLQAFAKNYVGVADVAFSRSECGAEIKRIEIGHLASSRLIKNNNSVLMQCISETLPKDMPPVNEAWEAFITPDLLRKILSTALAQHYVNDYQNQCRQLHAQTNLLSNRALSQSDIAYTGLEIQQADDSLVNSFNQRINDESAMAGALLALLKQKLYPQLESLFYGNRALDLDAVNKQITDILNSNDPFATFDPKRDIKNVSLSPLGIVHLFRQYFFELDTFLGTPTGHVWLSPGSTVELIEVSTRRVYTERVIEQSMETTQKTERSATDRDEISEAVKQDNKTDLKLGASLTVNQSWGTGNATATGSLNMDQTQQTAREVTHKRMREQTEKLSTEIRQNYKSTFKTITEVTDTASKRYVLANATPNLINYELRRKMRQVGVQVQDIGTYLCWETFVDGPGEQLGLANLVHIAKPADLVAVPVQSDLRLPDDQFVPFTANAVWDRGDNWFGNGPDGFNEMTSFQVPPGPDGFEVKYPNGMLDIRQVSANGKGLCRALALSGEAAR